MGPSQMFYKTTCRVRCTKDGRQRTGANQRAEFIPYVFQLFAALLEANPSATLSEYYRSLITPILTPALWSSKGNVPALVRLLTAIIQRDSHAITQAGQLENVLGIFQQLVNTKTNELYGFELLESVISKFSPSELQQYFTNILQVLLTRLQNHKTDSFALRFVRLYHFISAQKDKGLGTDFFIELVEQIQQGIYVPLYLNIILPDTQKLVRPLDRKVAVISLVITLVDSKAFADKYKKGWGLTCEALLGLLKNPPVPSKTDDTIAEQDPDDMSFGVGFTQLTTVRRPARDIWAQVTDVKSWVAAFVKDSNQRQGGKISSFAQERLSPEGRNEFAVYM